MILGLACGLAAVVGLWPILPDRSPFEKRPAVFGTSLCPEIFTAPRHQRQQKTAETAIGWVPREGTAGTPRRGEPQRQPRPEPLLSPQRVVRSKALISRCKSHSDYNICRTYIHIPANPTAGGATGAGRGGPNQGHQHLSPKGLLFMSATNATMRSLSLLLSLKLLYHQMPMGSPTLPAANSSQEPVAGPVHERGLLPAVEDLAGERACRAETEKACRGDIETV